MCSLKNCSILFIEEHAAHENVMYYLKLTLLMKQMMVKQILMMLQFLYGEEQKENIIEKYRKNGTMRL